MSDLITAKNMNEALEKAGLPPEEISGEDEMAVEFRRFMPLDEYLATKDMNDYVGLIGTRVVQGTIAFQGDEAFATNLYLDGEQVKLYTVRALGVTMPKKALREVYKATKKRMKQLAQKEEGEAKLSILDSASTFETMTAVKSCYERTFLFGLPVTITNDDGEDEQVWAGAFVLFEMKDEFGTVALDVDTYEFAKHIENLFTFYPEPPHDFYASVALETAAQYIQHAQTRSEDDPDEE